MDHDHATGALDLDHAQLWKVVSIGASMGVVHVVTGPDHLSALAALSSGLSWRAFALGVQWGCGHALGITIVAVICLSIGHALQLGTYRVVCNYVTGVFLIALGSWTLHQAKIEYDARAQPASNWSKVQCQDGSYMLLGDDNNKLPTRPNTAPMSVAVGLLHGVAGPGGVLGILPAVAMHHLTFSLVYLGCFCLSSILCMGALGALYGELTRRAGVSSSLLAFRIAAVSSCLSILVGLLWIILQAMGVLEHVFGHQHHHEA